MTNKITIDKALLEQAIEALPDLLGMSHFSLRTKLRAALAEPAVEPVAKAMTAHRAAYFMERFKKEEKLLGPNEQAAVDFVIGMLTATHTAPPPPAVEPVTTWLGTDWDAHKQLFAQLAHLEPGTDLYTSPPPPAEVPILTDVEFAAIASRHWAEDGVDPIDYGRSVEAAVRQKAGL